ncbi:MAG: DUF3006 domain-containing protein [Clostridium sp.]
MIEHFIIDRVEDDIYVLEDEDGNINDIKKCYIKTEAVEGDVLIKKDIYFYVDKEETEKRKREIGKLMKGLWVD